jgi:leader peptidase (prepilin peptidase)/N-methyltransferase
MLMAVFFAFLLGLVFGSFINVLVWRLDKNKKLVWARSECIYCSHQLGFFDLIPVLSFLFLKGQCQYCHGKISWQYPAVELAGGLGFLAIAHWVGIGWNEKIWLSGLFLVGLVIFVYDIKYLLIPNSFVATAFVWTLVGIFFLGQGNFISGLIGGAGLFSFFLILYLVSGGQWIGGGDVKLGFVLGLLLGWQLSLVALLLAYVLGAVIGVALVFFKKANFKSQVPFGPFLILSATVVQVWGYEIIKWYTGLFF